MAVRPADCQLPAVRNSLRAVCMVLLALLLGACGEALRFEEPPGTSAPAAAGEVHVVRPGETLYAIAFRYGLDHRELARINNLGDGSLIFPGQRIQLGGTARGAAAPAPSAPAARQPAPARRDPPGPGTPLAGGWQWPTAGAVVGRYGQSPQTQSGIQIGGIRGQPVVAAADGEVVYSGRGLIGYGALLIIKHDATWLSAYGHNDSLLVNEGDRVRAGQRIATMGEGPGRRPLLHFEIRRNGDPVDPAAWLPAR
ncbi:MAG: peptidoglycan DD-metalloendopeptidase family protein [Chromatiales bacterium]|nr:peptidoglycan DD-metalloendopeptidase family protein [Chromatiales bacterium]